MTTNQNDNIKNRNQPVDNNKNDSKVNEKTSGNHENKHSPEKAAVKTDAKNDSRK